MRVLSTKLRMQNDFSETDFYKTIIKWLKHAGPCAPIGEMFEECGTKEKVHLEGHYCTIDTFTTKWNELPTWLFKLEHEFHEQTWETEIIMTRAKDDIVIYFHIDCTGDVTRFDDTPDIRTDVIRWFVESGKTKEQTMPMTGQPIECLPENVEWIAKAIKGEYEEEIPLVLLTQFFNTMAYAVDENKVAKKLAGIAYVVICDNEDTRILEGKAGKNGPYNGAVAIYAAKGKPRILRQKDAYYGGWLDQQVMGAVQDFVTAKTDAVAPTWKELYNEMLRADALEKRILLDEAFSENGTLEEQLKRARERIKALTEENLNLNTRVDAMSQSREGESGAGLIIKASVTEFFEGEQYDLIVNALMLAKQHYIEDGRACELINQLLTVNPEMGNGRDALATLKAVLSNIQNPTSTDFAKLKGIGFEVISEQNHYKLLYKGNSKYQFTLFKTPSDHRGGKNLASDITKRISVYK